MSIETIIQQLLNTLVNGRVWENATPDVLPKDANGDFLPFILWTLHGGQDAEYVEQEMGEFRNCRVQLTAISRSSIAAGLLLDSARDRLLASDYTVGVYGSPLGTYDAARKLHGRLQQFGIWFQQ